MKFISFYEAVSNNIVPNMNKISHIQDMNIKELMQFLEDMNYEVSSKIDGSNISFGVLDNEVYVKSKGGHPTTNPEDFYSFAKEAKLPIMNAFGDTLKMLQNNGFKEWNTKWMQDDRIKKYENAHSIVVFGEVLNSPQVNTLRYDPEKIGDNTLIPLVVKLNNGTKEGVDVTMTKLGEDILTDFVEAFNGADGFNVYPKHLLDVDLHLDDLKKIKTYVNDNYEALTTRKRKGELAEKKQKDKAALEKMIKDYKKKLLSEIKDIESFLGNTTIEGLVIRNQKNGITKIVDTDKFTELNTKNWEDRKALRQEKRELYKDIVDSVGKNADILVNRDKQIELLKKKQPKTKNEMLQLILDDVESEVGFSNANVKLLIDKIKKFIEKLQVKLYNLNKDVDSQNYKANKTAIENEIEYLKNVVEKLSNNKLLAIEFILGRKQTHHLMNQLGITE